MSFRKWWEKHKRKATKKLAHAAYEAGYRDARMVYGRQSGGFIGAATVGCFSDGEEFVPTKPKK